MNKRSVVMVCAGWAAWGWAANGQNLIPNGGFESGNTLFSSDYSFSSGGNCCEGQYTVRGNGSTFNGSFVDPPPSSSGSTQMMVCNGATSPGLRVWYRTQAVTPGVAYRLNLRGCTAVAGGPAILQWKINGDLIGQATTLPGVTREWVNVPATWTETSGSVVLAVQNLNSARFPNDFYIDDLSMVLACPADFNGDGFLDFFDFDDFVTCFAGGPCPPASADFNDDGFSDFFDYDDFIAAFEAGC